MSDLAGAVKKMTGLRGFIFMIAEVVAVGLVLPVTYARAAAAFLLRETARLDFDAAGAGRAARATEASTASSNSSGMALFALIVCIVAILTDARSSRAIDFYEIQIYDTDTAPVGHMTLELHSNTTSTATGELAKSQMDVYQVHETLEATYGVLRWLEVGQYLATAKLSKGDYEYSGSRTKVHFGIPQTFGWPVQLGGNIELDYMRRAAEENPLTLELRPIVGASYRGFRLVGNFAFIKPFSGPQTHHGFQFDPSGELTYELNRWVSPALEYYGDMGPIQPLTKLQEQQHFVVPTLNFYFIPQLELNLGVGIGLTRASNGVFVKSIIGWTF